MCSLSEVRVKVWIVTLHIPVSQSGRVEITNMDDFFMQHTLRKLKKCNNLIFRFLFKMKLVFYFIFCINGLSGTFKIKFLVSPWCFVPTYCKKKHNLCTAEIEVAPNTRVLPLSLKLSCISHVCFYFLKTTLFTSGVNVGSLITLTGCSQCVRAPQCAAFF